MDNIIAASKDKIQIVMFYGDHCGPCRMMKPILSKLQGDDYDVHLLDVAKHTEAAVKYRVMAIPTIYIFQDGEPIAGFRGYVAEPKVRQILEDLKAA